jgi:hypothetical protein
VSFSIHLDYCPEKIAVVPVDFLRHFSRPLVECNVMVVLGLVNTTPIPLDDLRLFVRISNISLLLLVPRMVRRILVLLIKNLPHIRAWFVVT